LKNGVFYAIIKGILNHNMAEKETTPLEKPIQNIDLKAVNSLRKRIKRTLTGAAVALSVSGVTAHVAGKYVQGEYRESTGYSPDEKVVEIEEARERDEKVTVAEKKPPENESWIDKAKREANERLNKAKMWAKKEIDEGPERIEVIKEYKETVRQMKELKHKALETGDDIAYWLPFLLMFLASIKLAKLTMTANKKIKDFLDPERMKKLDEVERKTNEIIARVNLLSETVQENAQIPEETKVELEAITEEFAETSAIIERPTG